MTEFSPTQWMKENRAIVDAWLDKATKQSYTPGTVNTQKFLEYADSTDLEDINKAVERMYHNIRYHAVFGFPTTNTQYVGEFKKEFKTMEGFFHKFGKMPTKEDAVWIVWILRPYVYAPANDVREDRPYVACECYVDLHKPARK